MDLGRDGLWKNICWAALWLLAAVGAVVLLRGGLSAETAAVMGNGTTVVIDPGHGGVDGGAVATDGTVESAINLEVARRLDAVLRLCGQPTRLLRDADVSLHDDSAGTIREKKVSDLHNRVDAVNGTPGAVLISIHQNCFSSAKYHGAQVFYANGPLAQPWADLTQKNLRVCLDGENDRAAAPIPHSVYLMNHVTCPAILVECGFLSNVPERERLKDPGYQTALGLVIAGSWLQNVQRKG